MNEALLIDMLGELDPALLQNEYIEQDMKKERFAFLKHIFSFKKKDVLNTDKPAEESLYVEAALLAEDFTDTEEEDISGMQGSDEKKEDSENEWGFHIGIFKRKFNYLVKIISGIVATILVVIGIIFIIFKRHKGTIKLGTKKIQIIY